MPPTTSGKPPRQGSRRLRATSGRPATRPAFTLAADRSGASFVRMSADDTIAALATPSGESAIALIRVSGPAAHALATEILGRKPTPRFAVHAGFRDRNGTPLDDTVITFFEGPNSYTGEDV